MGTNENSEAKKGRVIDPMHPDEDKTGVKVGTLKERRQFHLSYKTMAVFLVLVAAIIASTLFASHKIKTASNTQFKRASTTQGELNSTVQKLKNNAPKSNASISEKTAYYDKLFIAYERALNYKQAAITFETRESISTDGLTYLSYLSAANCYHQLGEQTKAVQALDAAVKLAPKDGDPTAGYTYQTVLDIINTTRKEYGL